METGNKDLLMTRQCGKVMACWSWLLVALIQLVCLPQLRADSITAKMANGTTQTLAGVEVLGIAEEAGVTNAYVSFPSGDLYPVPLHNVEYIDFGDGAGREYDILLRDGARIESFPRTRVFLYTKAQGYTDGGFVAIDPGTSGEKYFIPRSNFSALLAAGQAVDTGSSSGPGPESSGEFGPTSPDPFSSDTGSFFEDDFGDGDGEDFTYTGPSRGGSEIPQWANAVSSIIEYGIWLIILTTQIWLIAYAFSNEDTNSGFLLIGGFFCCVLYPYKLLYGFNYKGSLRWLMLTLIILEALMWLLMLLIIVLFGAALFGALAMM